MKGDSLVAGKPRVWSDKQLGGHVNSLRNFDLAPDGKRVAALMPAVALAVGIGGLASQAIHVTKIVRCEPCQRKR